MGHVVNVSTYFLQVPQTEWASEKVARCAFRLASWLTEPICLAREFLYRARVMDASWRMVFLWLGVFACVPVGLVTALPAIALRKLGAFLQKDPFIRFNGEAVPKVLASNSFSLLSWNICAVGGGYSITDGGVVPIGERMEAILRKIMDKDADVNCLYEVFDVETAYSIADVLKERGYTDFCFNIGHQPIGTSSGIFIASKYKMGGLEFSRFPLEALVGRTKNCAKGIFAFDVMSQNKVFARIHATHLQHSEEPSFPTEEEICARKSQMDIMIEKVNAARDKCAVVTGDLNLDDEEYAVSSWKDLFVKGEACVGSTFGGDRFCASLMGKRVSGPLNLDHTMILKGSASSIATSLVATGYNADFYRASALSDHEGVYSEIVL